MVWELTELFGKLGKNVFNSSNNFLVDGPQQSLHERCYKAIDVTDLHPPLIFKFENLSTFMFTCGNYF